MALDGRFRALLLCLSFRTDSTDIPHIALASHKVAVTSVA